MVISATTTYSCQYCRYSADGADNGSRNNNDSRGEIMMVVDNISGSSHSSIRWNRIINHGNSNKAANDMWMLRRYMMLLIIMFNN